MVLSHDKIVKIEIRKRGLPSEQSPVLSSLTLSML